MRSFLDTNILVYADASDEPIKQAAAIRIISQLRRDGAGVVSTQVLQEFAHVALRKLMLPATQVRQRLDFYARFDVVPTTPTLIHAALDLHTTHGVAFYDALVVSAATVSQCSILFSEGLQSGRRFEGLLVSNPFLPHSA
jgi:predicted nucleic acid-binding protein